MNGILNWGKRGLSPFPTTVDAKSSAQAGAPGRAISRLAKLFVLFLSFAGLLLGATNVNAATCTSLGTGNWSVPGTWSCVGLPAATVPGAADAVVIANLGANHVVTVTANAAAASVTFTGGARGSQLVLGAGIALNVTGAVTINPSTSTNATRQKILAVGSGTLTAASITITGGTSAARTAQLTVSTGTITTTGSITFAGTATAARLIYTGTGTVNLAGNFGAGGTLTTVAGSILNFNGSVAQTAASYTTYNVVKVNNAAGLTMLGTSTIATLTIGDVTASSVFSDGGFQVTSAGTLNLTSGTFKLGSATAATTFPAFVTRNISAGTTVEYASGIAQAVSATPAYQNLTLSGAGNKTAAAGLTVNGNFTIVAGTFTAGAFAHAVGGNWSNGGTFTAGTSTVTFNGAAAQIIGGTSNTTFNNLTVSNGSGVSLASSPAISGTLTLTTGTITTGANTLITSASCPGSVARTSGYVIGNLQKAIPAGASTCNFEVGDATNYTPVSATFAALTTAGNLTASVKQGDHISITASGINATKSINRYWTLTNGGVGLPAAGYSATLSYMDPADKDAGMTTTCICQRWNGTIWSTRVTATCATGAGVSTIAGVNGFGDFAVGNTLGTYKGVNQLIDLREVY